MLAFAATFCVIVLPAQSLAAVSKSVVKQTQDAKSRSAANRKAANEEITKKQAMIDLISAKVAKVKETLTALANDGKVAKTDEGVAVMKELLKELQDLNGKVDQLRNDVDEIKGWIEGQNESLPIMETDIAQLKKFKPSFYVQMQYRDSDQVDKSGNFIGSHQAALRRFRMGATYVIDDKTEVKATFDGSAGTDTRGFELKDAILTYKIIPAEDRVGMELLAGQLPLPLGFELERSSSDREFPERATYNRRMMNGERLRGAYIRYGLGTNMWIWAGATGSLTVSDSEQSSKASMPFGRAAASGGLRYETNNMSIGVANFQGERPSITGNPATSAAVHRNYWYFDASLHSLLIPGLDLRGEVMLANDRVPNAAAGAGAVGVEMTGWQAQAVYNLNGRNQIFYRTAMFDPNKATGNNAVNEYGLGYRYYINPGASLTFTYEWFNDPAGLDKTYNVATLRYMFKF